jgi:outer membrane protein
MIPLLRNAFLVSMILVLPPTLCSGVEAAGIIVQLDEAPEGGKVVLMLFDSANSFGDFRDPFRTEVFEADGETTFSLSDVPAGEYALLLHHDANGNDLIDKNFIGIPTEPIAFSNNYRPKGPPSYQKARFMIASTQELEMEMELFRALGRRGRLGVGLGVIARSSPYVQYDGNVYQAIPALTYNGERFQLFGPILQVGIAGSGMLRLAATASYRIGVYEEKESPFLAGLGDRDSTAMAGLALEAELPKGVDLSLRYEHDILDRIGGGSAQLGLGKGISLGIARVMPQCAINWLSSDLSSHDFGVPESAATLERPAYAPGDTVSYEIGVMTFLELSREWRILASAAVEIFGDEVSNSPIVAEDHVVKGFFALNYVF